MSAQQSYLLKQSMSFFVVILWLGSVAFAAKRPDDVAHLKLWLRADALTRLRDGQPVASWPDSSGSRLTAAQSSSQSRPLFLASAINQKPAVSFDGKTQYLNLPDQSVFQDAADFDVFAVIRLTGATGYSAPIFSAGTSGANPLIGFNQGMMFYYNNRVYPYDFKAPQATSTGSFHILEYLKEVTDIIFSTDGAVTASGSLRSPSSAIENSYRAIGKSLYYGYLEGDLAELVMYDEALPDPDRAELTCYLSKKYAIKADGCQ